MKRNLFANASLNRFDTPYEQRRLRALKLIYDDIKAIGVDDHFNADWNVKAGTIVNKMHVFWSEFYPMPEKPIIADVRRLMDNHHARVLLLKTIGNSLAKGGINVD